MNTSLLSERQSLPLCTRYFSVVLDRIEVQVSIDDGPLRHSIQSALGLLPGGEFEVLGVCAASTDDESVEHLVGDLRTRGVELVSFIVCPDSLTMSTALQLGFQGARVLPSIEAILRESLPHVRSRNWLAVAEALDRIWEAESVATAQQALDALADGPLGSKSSCLVDRWRVALAQLAPFYDLPGRLQRRIRSADRLVQRLHQTLDRAIARHGAFADGEAALSFVHDALCRAMRARGGWAPLPAAADRRLYPPARAGVAAAEF